MSLSNQLTRLAGPVAAVAVVGALAVALTGCSGGSTSGTGGSGGVAAVVKGLDNPFFQSMQSGIESQGSTAGLR
jgi:ABC-type sugar transport system substrate-binding protein